MKRRYSLHQWVLQLVIGSIASGVNEDESCSLAAVVGAGVVGAVGFGVSLVGEIIAGGESPSVGAKLCRVL
jgi:ABC-type proline/glycine betaine transport system permease subunit